MTDNGFDRRTFVKGAGSLVVAGALAGCTDGGDGGTPTATDTPTPTSGSGTSPVSDQAKQRVDQFLTAEPATSNYGGSIVDATGKDEVVVEVGAKGNGGNFAFAPPAVAISSSATVSWQWTGKGGQHNVVSVEKSDFDFDSGNPKTSGDPFEQSFDNTGVGLYICEPHESLGMKGAVVVVE